MSFGSPWLLLLLLLVPAAVAVWRWSERRREARAARWAAPALLPNMVERPPRLRRVLPTALLLLGVTLLLVGFARPRAHVSAREQDATVVFVVDVSGSMAANDVRPTRLGAAKEIVSRYLDELPHGYRAALIAFSDHTALLASPTSDLTRVRQALAGLRAGPQGTALADAVAKAVDVGRSVKGQGKQQRPPAAIVVLSDGGQDAGLLSPLQAGAFAKKYAIPVTAIALGTPNGIVVQPLRGGYNERIQVPVQPQSLQQIASASGGRLLAPVAADPHATLAALGSRLGHVRKLVEISALAAACGIALMLAGGLLSGAWFRRLV